MSKRWNIKKGAYVEVPEIDAYLAEVIEVSKRHGFAISHEDGHGAFEVVKAAPLYFDWLLGAHDAREPRR